MGVRLLIRLLLLPRKLRKRSLALVKGINGAQRRQYGITKKIEAFEGSGASFAVPPCASLRGNMDMAARKQNAFMQFRVHLYAVLSIRAALDSIGTAICTDPQRSFESRILACMAGRLT